MHRRSRRMVIDRARERIKLNVLIQALEPRVLLSITPDGPEFRVNTYTPSLQSGPITAVDGDGDFVVAWQSDGQDGSLFGVYAQRYDASGAARGAEFRVNAYTTSIQAAPAAAMDADGDFVL